MDRITRLVLAHRRIVIGTWIVLTILGVVASGQLTNRWAQDFSLPGQPAYEADQRTFEHLHSGRQTGLVLVFQGTADLRTNSAVPQAIDQITKLSKDGRSASWWNTKDTSYLAQDGKVAFVTIQDGGKPLNFADPAQEAISGAVTHLQIPGVTAKLTGIGPIEMSQGGDSGSGVLVDALIGGVGALLILLLVFGTLPAVVLPLVIAIASIFTTYLAVWGLTYLTNVSLIVQFLIGLVGLGVAIDYALIMVFRFREELAKGEAVEEAVRNTVRHAGKAVIVSGSTVAIGLVSMVLIPVPFIRAIGLGGMLIPAVSVLAALTLMPVMFSMLGHRINRLRIPLVHRMANLEGRTDRGFWARWAAFVVRRPIPVFIVGALILAVFVTPSFSINPADSQVRNEPASGSAAQGRDILRTAKVSDGVYAPFEIVLDRGATAADAQAVAGIAKTTKGVVTATVPTGNGWAGSGLRVVEVIPTVDGASGAATATINRLKSAMADSAHGKITAGARAVVAGQEPESRDFNHAVYGSFPLVLAFVVVLTFLLLARALRSLVLPLKAVILNAVSIGSALGIITWIFQQGHLSHAIWGFTATDSIIAWIPLMIFAFLFGISMDYEVFMLSRIREAYDEGNDTSGAVRDGLVHTGKLVTSAAAVLMFSFIVLSTAPGPDFKEFAIGLAAGIVVDATLIRVLVVPATIRLLGRANWWLPGWAAWILRVQPSRAHTKHGSGDDHGIGTPEPELAGSAR